MVYSSTYFLLGREHKGNIPHWFHIKLQATLCWTPSKECHSTCLWCFWCISTNEQQVVNNTYHAYIINGCITFISLSKSFDAPNWWIVNLLITRGFVNYCLWWTIHNIWYFALDLINWTPVSGSFFLLEIKIRIAVELSPVDHIS